MNKKLIILTVFIGIIAGVFFLQNIIIEENGVTTEEKINEEEIDEEEINKVLSLIRENTHEDHIITYGEFVKKESLINLVHIMKDDSGYEINCFLGPAYENANLNKMFPDKLVSMGQIKECNIKTAKLIDEAVKSEKMGCDVFTSHIQPELNDYYFFAIKMVDREVTQEWIDALKEEWTSLEEPDALRCFEPMKNLLGETIAKHGTGIVDLDENILYF